MRSRRLAPLLLAALAGPGCGGGDEPREASATGARGAEARAAVGRHPLCTRLRARVTGRVGAPAATELSGLVVSRGRRGVLWAHNDSGDGPRLLALAPSGRLLADVTVPGAGNVDWEDLATGPAPGPRASLYAGDIGDNGEQRPAVVVYRVAEPRAGAGTGGVRAFTLRYPDRPHDAEALIVDPGSGALVIVTKSFEGTAGIYVAGRPAAGAVTTMRRAGRLSLGPGQAVTAGDVAADGRTVALRTYDAAYVWRRRRGQSVASALRRRPCRARARLLAEGQGETLALTRDGRAFFTVPEGPRPPLRRYAPVR